MWADIRKEDCFFKDIWRRNIKSKDYEYGVAWKKIKFTTTIRKVRREVPGR